MLLWMQLTLAHVGAAGGGKAVARSGFDALVEMYIQRSSAYARCQTRGFRTEEALLEWLTRQSGRTPAVAVLADSRGCAMDSETFATWIGKRRDEGAQHLVFAIGPASGWSAAARAQAKLLLSLGPLTMAHTLARLVLAEQLYRALTILAGHPYHAAH